MKNYKYFLKESSAKTVVFAFGRFQPPTTGHALLVSAVEKTAKTNTDTIIYVSKTQDKKKNPLSVTQKIHYLKLMFPQSNFKAANDQERTFMEVAKELNKKYKNLIMVAGSDRVAAFEKLLNQYNGTDYHYDSIQVVSAGERDPDADDASGMSGTKMRALALDGNYPEFKKGLPHTLKDADAKQLMNDIRVGMGKETISEDYSIRERYFQGEIFNVGDIVESDEIQYTILCRGTNYLFLEDQSGTKIKKWLQDVTAISSEENMTNEEESKKVKYTSSDKIKVARIIAGALGIDAVKSSPEELINMALRKIRNKPMHSEYIDTIKSMLSTADQAGIKYDKKLIAPKIEEAKSVINQKINYNKPIHDEKESNKEDEGESVQDENDEEIEDMIKHINDLEDILDEYEDDELHIVDEEGNHVSHIKEEFVTEVLSRMERMKAKIRFARTASKRERKLKIALHTKSSPEKINRRARVMAVRLLKMKIAKKPLNKLSIQEKERVERIIKRKGAILNRISMKLVPRIRAIEGSRLHPVNK
jgi:nicotinic acid mononucleotide adenylyltransferase